MKSKSFSDDVRRSVHEAQHGFCAVDGCLSRIDDYHHILRNTKPNNKRYPTLINSVFNCKGVCREHHEKPSLFRELNMPLMVGDCWENYLKQLKEGK